MFACLFRHATRFLLVCGAAALGSLAAGSKTPASDAAPVPTYAGRVAAIMRAKCEGCHHPGDIGPFPLQTYKQAAAWAKDIKLNTQNHLMPPWKPVHGYGEFRNEATFNLTDDERSAIARWVDAGAPQGDPRKTPPPRTFDTGWKLGKPDMVLDAGRDFHVPAEGEDVYRNFVLRPHFTEDRYVSSIEVQPGARAVVHHILVFCDPKADSDRYEARYHSSEPGYGGGTGINRTSMLGGWAPGNEPPVMPDGVALRIPKGANIVLQIHYHLNGKATADRTRVGLHFARTTVHKQVYTPMAVNVIFSIPPGDSHHEVRCTATLAHDNHLIAISPHMHLLGREMKVWAVLPDGTQKPLIWINDWDLSWQNTYLLKEPVALPAGTKIELVSYFDNSTANPRNPNRAHLKTVTWGDTTFDEMCIAFLGVTRDDEDLNVPPNITTEKSAGADAPSK